ncbi:MAG: DUF523 domain-containing protein [Desulfovibrio sp.]|nr:DUF523 domain-containing protein [Desulfovibrio sp.]
MWCASVVVSACLIGHACRYDGRSNYRSEIAHFVATHPSLPICPEVLGNLSIPRLPAERCGDQIIRIDGVDVTDAFRLGVLRAMFLTIRVGARLAILKSRSPSCGIGQIYDGNFTKTLCSGHGVWTEVLLTHKIQVISEENFAAWYAAKKAY